MISYPGNSPVPSTRVVPPEIKQSLKSNICGRILMIRIRPFHAAILAFILSGFAAGAPFVALAAEHHSQAASPAAAPPGKALFEGTCAVCHGVDGSGASGPNIRHAAASLGPDGIENLIKVGFIGSGMPTFGQLGDVKIHQIVDYVVSFDQEGAGVTLGDPQEGKAVYSSKNCSQCHIVDGRGGNSGPDLSRIGAVRSTGSLRSAIVSPGSKLPTDALLAERAQFRAYVMLRAVTKKGREIIGMRVNDDTFSVQLREADGQIVSLRKLDLQTLEELPAKSFMPNYKDTLSDTEVNDLVGYLASLRGAQ
jgi:cytochrome c oxidase cbb3-type subunit 3